MSVSAPVESGTVYVVVALPPAPVVTLELASVTDPVGDSEIVTPPTPEPLRVAVTFTVPLNPVPPEPLAGIRVTAIASIVSTTGTTTLPEAPPDVASIVTFVPGAAVELRVMSVAVVPPPPVTISDSPKATAPDGAADRNTLAPTTSSPPRVTVTVTTVDC